MALPDIATSRKSARGWRVPPVGKYMRASSLNSYRPSCCTNELPLYWRLNLGTGISDFSADLTFSYTDEDAAGFTESEAYWGIAWYNEASSTWNWKGGVIDADAHGDHHLERRQQG